MIAIKIARRLLSLPQRALDRLHVAEMRRLATVAKDAKLAPQASIYNCNKPETITIGSKTLFMAEIRTISAQASVNVGRGCFIGVGTRLWVMQAVEIGDNVLISHNVNIIDNNSHSMSASDRREHFSDLWEVRDLKPKNIVSAPIRIGSDAWIGINSSILKGVTIGQGAVVGACSVVTSDVEPFAVVVGNPARKIGSALP